MNSKKFLSQLLKPENTVPADGGGQECMICQEEYSTDISVVERQIRLPCNPKHTVGSNCIVTWLQAHNTCPICRYEFFPKEKNQKSNIDRERMMELLVSLLEDGDEDEEVVDQDGDVGDEDFVDEELETEDNMNMSDEDEGMSEED